MTIDEKVRVEAQPIDPDALLSKPEVLKHADVSATTLYSNIQRGIFPAPIKIGLRRSAWRGADIIRWKQMIFSGVLSEPDGIEQLRAAFAKSVRESRDGEGASASKQSSLTDASYAAEKRKRREKTDREMLDFLLAKDPKNLLPTDKTIIRSLKRRLGIK